MSYIKQCIFLLTCSSLLFIPFILPEKKYTEPINSIFYVDRIFYFSTSYDVFIKDNNQLIIRRYNVSNTKVFVDLEENEVPYVKEVYFDKTYLASVEIHIHNAKLIESGVLE